MSCSSPILAVDLGLKDNGKKNIKILPIKYRPDFDFEKLKARWGSSLVALPCGSCSDCILTRRKLWALRCYAESLYHEQNCFVTLTYDPASCPDRLKKSDFQSFIKALRNAGVKVRYFGCGEYGELGRPHLHLILFGFFPNDIKYYSKTKSGFNQFTSQFLSKLWNKGIVTVTQFTPELAAYTAGYVDKKYKQFDCFVLMSKRPGIGEQYFMDHYVSMYKNGRLITNFGSHFAAIPRYFDKLAEKIGLDLSDIKDKRLEALNYNVYSLMKSKGFTRYEELLQFNKRISQERLERKVRGL